MTREEAIYELGRRCAPAFNYLIDKIYDDFEEELDKARKEGYVAGSTDCFILLTGKEK